MEIDVLERIKLIMREFNLSERQFALRIGKKSQTVNAMFKRGKTDIMLATAVEILKAFPAISPEWFIMGEGSMFREEKKDESAEDVDYLKDQIAFLQGVVDNLSRTNLALANRQPDPYSSIAAEGSHYGKKESAG